jgi:hypothetical protein
MIRCQGLSCVSKTKTFLASTSTDPLILTHGERDVLLLGRAAKSPADHPTAPPENPPTPYRRLFLHSLSPCTEKTPSFTSPRVVIAGSWVPPCLPHIRRVGALRGLSLVGRYRHLRTTSTLPTTVSYRILEQSHLLRDLTPHFVHRKGILFYIESGRLWTQFHDLPHCLVSALRPRMRHGRWMTNGSLLGDH